MSSSFVESIKTRTVDTNKNVVMIRKYWPPQNAAKYWKSIRKILQYFESLVVVLISANKFLIRGLNIMVVLIICYFANPFTIYNDI